MHIYKYVQAHIILHHNVSVTPVTIIRVLYNKNTKDNTNKIPINIFNHKQHALCVQLYFVAASSEPKIRGHDQTIIQEYECMQKINTV